MCTGLFKNNAQTHSVYLIILLAKRHVQTAVIYKSTLFPQHKGIYDWWGVKYRTWHSVAPRLKQLG